MALGATRGSVLRRFLCEGLALGVVGGATGLVVGVFLAIVISAVGIPMPPPPGMSQGYNGEIKLTAALVASAFGLACLTALLASVYPAWKASRLVIVDALRRNI
jgi:putative ABC transport system permease protein